MDNQKLLDFIEKDLVYWTDLIDLNRGKEPYTTYAKGRIDSLNMIVDIITGKE